LANPYHMLQDANNRPPEPIRIFFGRCVSEGVRNGLISKMSIKTRKFIGNTTMDATLSLLMANLAMVNNGDMGN
jgi:tRNA (guanine10-N2)-methyltransferase